MTAATTMMNSALASTMQTHRTTSTRRFAKRSSRSRNFTAAPASSLAFDVIRKPDSTPDQVQCRHCRDHAHAKGGGIAAALSFAPAPPLEVFLAVENKGDGL